MLFVTPDGTWGQANNLIFLDEDAMSTEEWEAFAELGDDERYEFASNLVKIENMNIVEEI